MFGAKPQGGMSTTVLTRSVRASGTSSAPTVPSSYRWGSMATIKNPYAGYSNRLIDSTQPGFSMYDGGMTNGAWLGGSGTNSEDYPILFRVALPYDTAKLEWITVPVTLQYSGASVDQLAPDGTAFVTGPNRNTYLWQAGTNYLLEVILPGRTGGVNGGTQTYVVFWNGSGFTIIYGRVSDGAGVTSVFGRAAVGLDGTVVDLGNAFIASGVLTNDFVIGGQWRNPESFLFSGTAVSVDGGAIWTLASNATLLNRPGWRQVWGHPTVDRVNWIKTSSVNSGVTSYSIQYLFLKRDGSIATTTSAVPIVSPSTGMYNIKYYYNMPDRLVWMNGTWLLEDSYGSLYRTSVDITTSSTPAWQLITDAFIQQTPGGEKLITEVPGCAY